MSSSSSSSGISFVGLLTIVFITLKLTGFISWSWWWVLSPPLIVTAIIFAYLGLVIWSTVRDDKQAREYHRKNPYR